MTFDYDFGYSFLLSSSLLEEKNSVPEIVIKSHAFLLDPFEIHKKTRSDSDKNYTSLKQLF